MATEEQKARLAAACQRLARELLLETMAVGGGRVDKTRAAKEFAAALFECRDELGDVAEILPTLCVPEQLPEVLRALEEFGFHPTTEREGKHDA